MVDISKGSIASLMVDEESPEVERLGQIEINTDFEDVLDDELDDLTTLEGDLFDPKLELGTDDSIRLYLREIGRIPINPAST